MSDWRRDVGDKGKYFIDDPSKVAADQAYHHGEKRHQNPAEKAPEYRCLRSQNKLTKDVLAEIRCA